MQQTLLALAAILVFSFYALGRHRTDNDVDRRAISVEVELAATDAAQAQMAVLESLAFDEDDVGRTGVRRTPPTSGLGPDSGELAPLAYDDIDDWHGRVDTVSVAVGVGALRFVVATEVGFVDTLAPDTPSALPTLAKETRVLVSEVADAPLDRAPVRIDLRRVVTPASVAASAR
ncbi:MAG: hypothetical protein AAF845_13620 [Bacteroidota bacterium]